MLWLDLIADLYGTNSDSTIQISRGMIRRYLGKRLYKASVLLVEFHALVLGEGFLVLQLSQLLLQGMNLVQSFGCNAIEVCLHLVVGLGMLFEELLKIKVAIKRSEAILGMIM